MSISTLDSRPSVLFPLIPSLWSPLALFLPPTLPFPQVPNLELGHMELDGVEAEAAAAGVLVEKQGLTWQQWADKVTWYLGYVESLFWPARIVSVSCVRANLMHAPLQHAPAASLFSHVPRCVEARFSLKRNTLQTPSLHLFPVILNRVLLQIVGGGVSNAHEKWLHLVKLPQGTPILPAQMKNDAGIVGAALAAVARAAYEKTRKPQQVDDYIQA